MNQPRMPSVHQSITPAGGPMPPVQTRDIFKHQNSVSYLSAIDRFTQNCNEISRLVVTPSYLSAEDPMPPELATIAILGYVSAVESYLRAVLAGIIGIDEYAQLIVERRMLTYGAVLHHKTMQLPDALLEGTSFASRENVKDALRDFLRIQVSRMPSVDDALISFQRICEIRHCCVHRFGRLGSNNAISLGLSEHSLLLEARVEPDINQLQAIFLSLRVLVRSLNTGIFQTIIERTALPRIDDEKFPFSYPHEWKWRWNSDRPRFGKYYNLFASTRDTVPSPPVRAVYDSFRALAKTRLADSARRGR